MFQQTPAIQVFVKPFCISLNRFRVKANFVVTRIGKASVMPHPKVMGKNLFLFAKAK